MNIPRVKNQQTWCIFNYEFVCFWGVFNKNYFKDFLANWKL